MKIIILNILTFILLFTLISCSTNTDEKLESIFGKWELEGYLEGDSNQIDSQGLQSTPVTITFDKDNFNGKTPSNSFFGSYTITSDILNLNNINTTEITESNWGIRFMSALNDAYDNTNEVYILKFKVQNNVLSIEYDLGKFMVFKKL